MDADLLQFLTDDQKARYAMLEALFEHGGWTEVEKLATAHANAQLDRLASATTWEQNRVAYGMRLAYAHFANLREITEKEFTLVAEQQREQVMAGAEDNEII